METLYDFFFSYETFQLIPFITKLILFTLVSLILVFIVWFILIKTIFRERALLRENIVKLALLWSVNIFFIFFSIYLYFFLRYVGIENIIWTNWNTYLILLPQIMVFILFMIFGIVSINKEINLLKPLNI